MELVLALALLPLQASPVCQPRWLPMAGQIGLDHQVVALAVFDDGGGPAVYAGGSFGSAEGVSAPGVGASWSALESGMDNAVYALATFDDGGGPALYAGGTFSSVGGVSANGIARWDGASWSALGSGVSDLVYALVPLVAGGERALYAGGAFADSPAGDDFIARWGCVQRVRRTSW